MISLIAAIVALAVPVAMIAFYVWVEIDFARQNRLRNNDFAKDFAYLKARRVAK